MDCKYAFRKNWLCFRAADIPKEILKDQTLTADTIHILKHQTYVRAGTTLTIERGTTIAAFQEDGKGQVKTILPA